MGNGMKGQDRTWVGTGARPAWRVEVSMGHAESQVEKAGGQPGRALGNCLTH